MWNGPVDNYCERLTPDLLAEPLNFVSNAAFLIAAYALWKLYRKQPQRAPLVLLLIVLIAVVGVGSALFHSFGNTLTLFMDIVPILVFLSTYVFAYVRLMLQKSVGMAWGAMVLFVLLNTYAVAAIPASYQFNGTSGYFVAYVVLILMAMKYTPLWCAVTIFTVSMVFRSLDMQLCDAWPLGTHFLWHALNGITLYLAVKALMGKPAT